MKSILVILCLCFSSSLFSQVTLVKENESCAGKKDGKIEVMVEGISSPLTYAWEFDGQPFAGGKKLSGLAPGDYSVTVSTKDGCMAMKAAKIWAGTEVNVDIYARLIDVSPSPIPCGIRPTFTYELTAQPSGGKPPYYCSWGEVGLGQHVSGGGGGECTKVVSGQVISQTVAVYDDAGCIDSDAFKKIAAIKYCPKDPNDITGPDGYDTVRWVSVHDDMDYAVRFENDPDFATSNAAVVLITIPIDDDIDPFSFRLNALGFGSKIIEVPANSSYYQERLDYSEDLGFLVDVTAGLDLPNNRFFWLLETIDPLTGQPPTDPTAGFLPVNDTLTGSGEGFVNFICKPKSTTPTGETVDHQASIIFDLNGEILTNIWTNSIDALPPSTVYTPLPDTINTNEVTFNWSVADDPGGCGVQYSEILLSEDDQIFGANGLVTDTNAQTLNLQWGKTYFYKIASTDFVDNEEEILSDSFYIIPQRAIEFTVPDQNGYCIGDTMQIQTELVSIEDVDLYMSIDSGMTYTLLASGIDSWPYPLVLDSGFLHPHIFLKARNEIQDIETVSIPFTVRILPVVDAGPPIEGCAGEVLFVDASGANAYTWEPEILFGTPTNRYTNIYASVNQFISVRGTDVFGCSSVDSTYITIHQVSRDTLSQPLCEGDSVYIDDAWINDEGYYTTSLLDAFGCDSLVTTQVYFESPCIWTGGPYVYTDQDATGLNNGTSWVNAFNDLQDAIYVAGRYENVQEIWVAEGIYLPHASQRDTSFVLLDSIKIYGGFLGFESNLEDRTANAALVQLSGDINVLDTLSDNSFHTVIISDQCVECVIDGVTITYGYADQAINGHDIGAGVLNKGHGHFINVVFERNYATDHGAALHSSGNTARLIIEDCLFRLNTSILGRDVVNTSGSEVEFRGANAIH